MRNKIISVAEAVDMIPDGATIMYGGFLGCGSAHHIIEALAQKGTKDLTIIGNDCGMATGPNGEEFYGVAKLVHNHQVKHVIATHVGMTPDVGTQGMVDKTLTVDLIPRLFSGQCWLPVPWLRKGSAAHRRLSGLLFPRFLSEFLFYILLL